MTRILALVTLGIALMGFAQGSLAAPIAYTATLTGANESPPNASPGTGFAWVDMDLVAHFLHVQVTFQDLLGITTACHIHGPTAVPGVGTAGVAMQTPTFTGFPTGVTSGTYDHTFDTLDLATYNPAFVTANGGTAAGAETVLAASLTAGTAYLNIHTSERAGGEIRGFLTQPVPEPASFSLLALGGIGLLFVMRRKR